jgi:hypothetical protein
MRCQPDTPHRAKIAHTGGKHASILWLQSKRWPNQGMQATANSVRSCLAPAVRRA